MLEQERQFYSDSLAGWLSRYPGKFILVKERELVGAFDTIEEALATGARQFGMQPFLVRRVAPSEETVSIPALSLGILSADSSRSI